jgi:hypothetical protein
MAQARGGSAPFYSHVREALIHLHSRFHFEPAELRDMLKDGFFNNFEEYAHGLELDPHNMTEG